MKANFNNFFSQIAALVQDHSFDQVLKKKKQEFKILFPIKCLIDNSMKLLIYETIVFRNLFA